MGNTAWVETVLGPVDADRLGIILPHEHLPSIRGVSEALEPPDGYLQKLERLQREAMREVLAYGAGTMVELTPIGSGRFVPMMRRLSRQTGLHVVASTGFYLAGRRPEWVKTKSTDELAEIFVQELTEQIAGTEARAWMIKIAAGAPKDWCAEDEKVFRAAVLASRKTGAAITTHSCSAVRQHFDFLAGAGADPARLYIGHADFDNGEDLQHVARNGGHLIFTCWGIEHFVKQEELLGRVMRLAESYPQAVLLSTDYAICVSDNRMDLISMEYECPDRTHAFLFRHTLPALLSKGLGGELIRKFILDNPRQMLVRPPSFYAQAPVAGAEPTAISITSASTVVKSFAPENSEVVLRVINAYIAGWPYSRPLDAAVLEHWKTLGPAWQPQDMLIAFQDGIAKAFLHGEQDPDQKTFNIHILAMLPGAVAAAVALLAEAERLARAAGLKTLRGPFYRSNLFYGGYVCGCEPYHPHWATDGTEAFVTGGFRISHPAVIMVCDLARAIEVENAPQGYQAAEAAVKEEFGARTFRYIARHNDKEAATCTARLYPALLSRGEPAGQIGFVGTEKEHQGKGLSRVLVKLCLKRLREWGAAEALIATGLDNYPALRSYERAGFVRRYNINEWSKELR